MDNKEETEQPIYISFNKTDSSVSSFISYLIAALDCRGIKLFYGFKLFLVVFSSDYAISVPCLENLVKLLEVWRNNKNSYVVVPVFFGVSRLTVQKQTGMFSDAFTKLEMSYSAVQVTKWRCALAETTELQGHEYNDEMSEESEFVEEIAQDVFEKLYPTEEIGIHKRRLEIENLLCKQPWGVRSLGILGESGVGKTTLSIAVNRGISSGYDDSVFIEDFHSRYTEKRLEPLSGDFLCMTPVEKFDLNNSDFNPCYRQKRVLVVLDDVRNARDVESFLGGFDRFGPGSLIVITSIYKRILEECHVNEIYELKGLNVEDALKLFTRCVFGNGAIEQNLLNLSMRVIECSDGNPSTLISYAGKLKGKKTKNLESALLEIYNDAFMNTSLSFISSGNDDEHGVLDTRDTKSIFRKQSIQCPAQRFLFDLEKLPVFDHPSCVRESLPSDLIRVSHLDYDPGMPSFSKGFACQFHKISETGGYYKSFSRLKKINLGHIETLTKADDFLETHDIEQIDLRDCTSIESLPFIEQLEPLHFLNLSDCIEIKCFPEPTIRELKLEGQSLQWGLQTDNLCLLCNSAKETRSHLYFDCTFSWSIWTAISSRIHLSPLRILEDVHSAMVNLTGSKAKKILSRMACNLTVYGLWVERNHRLYKQSYRSADSILAQIDVMIRNRASSLRTSKPKIASEVLQLWFGTSSPP